MVVIVFIAGPTGFVLTTRSKFTQPFLKNSQENVKAGVVLVTEKSFDLQYESVCYGVILKDPRRISCGSLRAAAGF